MRSLIRQFLRRISSPWALFCVAALGLLPVAKPPQAQGETMYYPGDVVTIRASALDSLGRAFLPTSARGFVYTSSGIIDSSNTYPSGGMTQPIPAVAELKWSYTIPAGTSVVDYIFTTIFSGEGFVRDLAVSEPGRARVNAYLDSVGVVATAISLTEDVTPDSIRAVGTVGVLTEAFPAAPTFIDSVRAVSIAYLIDEEITVGAIDSIRAVGTVAELTEPFPTFIDSVRAVGTVTEVIEEITASVAAVDSITPNAALDLLVATAGLNTGVVDSTDCTPCGVYELGEGVDNAQVYITRTDRLYTMSDVVGYDDRTVDGYWDALVPLNPGIPDTFYVWAWYQGTYQVEGERLIVP